MTSEINHELVALFHSVRAAPKAVSQDRLNARLLEAIEIFRSNHAIRFPGAELTKPQAMELLLASALLLDAAADRVTTSHGVPSTGLIGVVHTTLAGYANALDSPDLGDLAHMVRSGSVTEAWALSVARALHDQRQLDAVVADAETDPVVLVAVPDIPDSKIDTTGAQTGPGGPQT